MSENKEAEYFKKKYNFKNSVDDDDEDDGDQFSKSNKGKNQNNNSKTPILDSFSRDLTKMAQDGKLDPVVGRGKEIERVSQILSRRKKNNPILIGEPGCVDGETLIIVRKVSDYDNHKQVISV